MVGCALSMVWCVLSEVEYGGVTIEYMLSEVEYGVVCID